jgi:hypothetical protein
MLKFHFMIETAGGQKSTLGSQSSPDKAKHIEEHDQARNKLCSIVEPCKTHHNIFSF